MIYIIGCGGVGSWLCGAITRLTFTVGSDAPTVTLVDGDTLEESNLDRQLFSKDEVGSNKAFALSKRIPGCTYKGQWYRSTSFRHLPEDWLLCCVDNNPARASVLEACDNYGCSAIVGANEVNSSEAYIYRPQWKDHELLDPRIQYSPSIINDKSGDPQAVQIGCTGKAQEQTRQLVTANMMAAALMAHLYVIWAIEADNIKPSSHKHLPVRLHQNITKNCYVLRGDLATVAERI